MLVFYVEIIVKTYCTAKLGRLKKEKRKNKTRFSNGHWFAALEGEASPSSLLEISHSVGWSIELEVDVNVSSGAHTHHVFVQATFFSAPSL